MTYVKIAEFKSRLSHYLDLIRNGEQVIVTDRKTPIARVSPYVKAADRLAIVPARVAPAKLREVKIPPMPLKTDSLKALQEERTDDLEGQ